MSTVGNPDLSFFDALDSLDYFEKESSVETIKTAGEHPHLSPFPRSLPERGTSLPTRTPPPVAAAPIRPKPQPQPVIKAPSAAKMASPKAQGQCQELCHKTTALTDRISIHVLECLTSVKPLPHGFEGLAHDFVDICQILYSIEAGLEDCNRSQQRFPLEMIDELNRKFRATQGDFHVLDQMLGKLLQPSSSLKRGWGKIFGDNDIKKISLALGRTRESLRMSSLVFQWSLGTEKIEREMGIGFTGLAAALDRMDHRSGLARTTTNAGNSNSHEPAQGPSHAAGHAPNHVHNHNHTHGQPSHAPSHAPSHGSNHGHNHGPNHGPQQGQWSEPHAVMDNHPRQQQLQSHVPSGTWSDRSSSIHPQDAYVHEYQYEPSHYQESFRGFSGAGPLNLDLRSPTLTHLTASSSAMPSNSTLSTAVTDPFDRMTILDDARSLTSSAESESFFEDLAGMDLGSANVVRIKADPSSMPRIHPRHSADSESANMRTHLIAAIRSKNHKLVEQLLNRGVPANTGPNMHALKEAIYAHDAESVKLLLL